MSDPAPMPVAEALQVAYAVLHDTAKILDDTRLSHAAEKIHKLADALPDGETLRWVLGECPPTAKGPEYGLGMVAARAQIRRLAKVLGEAPRS